MLMAWLSARGTFGPAACQMRLLSDADKELCSLGFTENIGLPLNLLEKHDPWRAYVTYTSPVVQRLIENSKMKELQCTHAFEQSQQALRPNKSSSATQLKRRKSSKSSGEGSKHVLSGAMLSMWGPNSVSASSPIVVPEPKHIQTDSRESPTANYSKIIFSRKPMMRMLPYSSLQSSKEKHANVQGVPAVIPEECTALKLHLPEMVLCPLILKLLFYMQRLVERNYIRMWTMGGWVPPFQHCSVLGSAVKGASFSHRC
ncbi:LOW QUALITY PROTEIN: CMT1A duplicated region transcript 4 protein [Erethizon dorsatum]